MANYNISLIDKFSELIASMRLTGIITGTSVQSDMLLINSVNSLSADDVIEIDDKDYIVYEPTEDSFKIYASSVAETTWTSKAPYFMAGHMVEIANALTIKDQQEQVYSYQKYPLIALITDIPEERTKFGINAKVRLLIMTLTDPNYSTAQREIYTFAPILYPLYEQLISALKQSRTFAGDMDKHTKTNRYFWGTQLAMMNGKTIMNDHIDAIEIDDLELSIYNHCN